MKPDFSFLKDGVNNNKEKENVLIISLSDLHLDVKTVYSETGNDSDMYSSSKRAYKAVSDILRRANAGHGIEEIIFIGGNDFYHANNSRGTIVTGKQLKHFLSLCYY